MRCVFSADAAAVGVYGTTARQYIHYTAHRTSRVPISIDEFESGEVPTDERSVPLRVAVYLHEHADQAFTRSEIAGAIDADPNTVGTALSRLKQADLVRHRGTYWAITEDTERLRAAYDLHEATERAVTEEQASEPEG